MKVTSDTGNFAIIPMWVLRNTNATAVVVYGELAGFADNKTLACFPSHRTLSESLGVSVSTVKRAIGDLVSIGAIVKQNRFKSDGSPTSNEYVVIRSCPDQLRTEDSSEPNPPTINTEPTSVQNRTEDSSDMDYKLEPLNYNHITKPTELDIMPEQSSSEQKTILVTTSKSKQSKPEHKLVAVKELTYEPIGKIKPKGTQWQDLFQAILDACTMDAKDLTKSAAGEVGAAAKQIWDTGGRAQDIQLRAECYKVLFNSATVTPSALAKHWPKCTPAKVEEDQARAPERKRAIHDYAQKDRFAHLEQKALNQ